MGPTLLSLPIMGQVELQVCGMGRSHLQGIPRKGVPGGLFWAQAATLPSQRWLTLPTAFTLHWCCYLPPPSVLGLSGAQQPPCVAGNLPCLTCQAGNRVILRISEIPQTVGWGRSAWVVPGPPYWVIKGEQDTAPMGVETLHHLLAV